MYRLIIGNKAYSSWSLRPWILMRQLQIPFKEQLAVFGTPSSYEAFRAFSPTGLVPCLIDGDRTIWDSLGITMYLAERHGGIWAEDDAARGWSYSAVAEMHNGFRDLRNECPMAVGVRVKPKPFPDAVKKNITRLTELWAEGLNRFGGPFLAGASFTAPDAFFAPVAYRAQTFGIDMGPDGNAWMETLLAQPAMREWTEAALAEEWREEVHEAEITAAGTIIADRRGKASGYSRNSA